MEDWEERMARMEADHGDQIRGLEDRFDRLLDHLEQRQQRRPVLNNPRPAQQPFIVAAPPPAPVDNTPLVALINAQSAMVGHMFSSMREGQQARQDPTTQLAGVLDVAERLSDMRAPEPKPPSAIEQILVQCAPMLAASLVGKTGGETQAAAVLQGMMGPDGGAELAGLMAQLQGAQEPYEDADDALSGDAARQAQDHESDGPA